MRMKHWTTGLAGLLLGLAAAIAAPPEKEREAPGQARQAEPEAGGARIIIRSEEEKHRRAAEQSNRQSEPGATRGLERAEERRAEPADEHSQAGGKSDRADDSPWYKSWFGGSDKPEDKEKPGEKKRWWWPFD